MLFLVALLIGLIGASIVFLDSAEALFSRTVAFVVLSIIYTLIGWWIIYAGLLSTAYPLAGGYAWILFTEWLLSAIVSCSLKEDGSWSLIFPIVAFIILLIVPITGAEMFNSSRYASLIGDISGKTEKHWSQDIQPLDPTHIRLVPKEQAISMAKTALSDNGNTLGSQFPIAEEYATLQKIRGDYFYLIPLDFDGWAVWTKADFVPGYIKISATDPYAKPMLITGKKFRYTPGAYFGDNLERRLYGKYHGYVLEDYSFEEDDNGHVYYVITACQPTIKYWGEVVAGIVLYDPETGSDKFYSSEQLNRDKSLSWIDRVIPAALVNDYIDYWGDLRDGWWNSFWSKINLLKAETPTINYSSDGRCTFVSPVTSQNDNDQAMTGLMYTDSRTGKFTYYTISGGATEEAVIQAANNVVSYKKWHASEQIVYENVYGKKASLVPILGENGNYQALAIVENENKRVAIGTTPQEALMEFQKMIINDGGQISTENRKEQLSFTGKVSRIGWEISNSGKQYYILVAGIKHSFIVSSQVPSELSLTKEGDEVAITYFDVSQAAIPAISFKNLTLDLKSSPAEKSVAKQNRVRQQAVKNKADVKDFKEKVKDMSDEEVQKLLKK